MKSIYTVYLIRAEDYVKIGYARDPDKRLAELQTGNPKRLKMMFRIPATSKRHAADLESMLHEACAEHRRQGEWFWVKGVKRVMKKSGFKISNSSGWNDILREVRR